jgi:hypothetical protein
MSQAGLRRAFGWKPDVPDHRDHLFSALEPNLSDDFWTINLVQG